jgi:hypothetical protein
MLKYVLATHKVIWCQQVLERGDPYAGEDHQAVLFAVADESRKQRRVQPVAH